MRNMAESPPTSTSIKLYCPIEQTWTITEEEIRESAPTFNPDLNDEDEIDNLNCIISETKDVKLMPGIKHNLTMYLDAKEEATDISLYLDFSGIDNHRIHGKFSFFVKSANYFAEHDAVFDKANDGWGDDICKLADLNDPKRNFIADGKFIVQMKGILIIEVNKMPKVIQREISPLVQKLWEKDDKDFKIIVGDEGTVMVHKWVLSACSDTFEAMFRSGREETITNTLKIIDFRLKTIQAAVRFFYDQNVFDDMDLADAFELVRFGDKYVINDLQDKLITHISYRISPSTICELTNRLITANSIKLRQYCFGFMMICLRHTIRVDHFDILDKEFAAELLQKALSSSFV